MSQARPFQCLCCCCQSKSVLKTNKRRAFSFITSVFLMLLDATNKVYFRRPPCAHKTLEQYACLLWAQYYNILHVTLHRRLTDATFAMADVVLAVSVMADESSRCLCRRLLLHCCLISAMCRNFRVSSARTVALYVTSSLLQEHTFAGWDM